MHPIRTRFAPSPTGLLHLGHAYAAKIAHDFARNDPNGQFLLRFEDIDQTRSREPFYTSILDDLKWLKLPYDETPLLQSARSHAYQAALDTLKAKQLVYPCFCTRKDIQQEWANIAGAPQGPEGPIYPGTCRAIPAEKALTLIHKGIPHAWRLHAAKASQMTGTLTFNDLKHGIVTVNPSLLGDVILARKDIGTAYHLAVVVDDAFQHITHITRGDDLLSSTHVHRLLQALLNYDEPTYFHHPLILDELGQRLAKRNLSQTLTSLQKKHPSPDSIFLSLPPCSLHWLDPH